MLDKQRNMSCILLKHQNELLSYTMFAAYVLKWLVNLLKKVIFHPLICCLAKFYICFVTSIYNNLTSLGLESCITFFSSFFTTQNIIFKIVSSCLQVHFVLTYLHVMPKNRTSAKGPWQFSADHRTSEKELPYVRIREFKTCVCYSLCSKLNNF